MCGTYMGELGEVTVYNVYKKNPKSRRKLEDFLCRSKKDSLRNECISWEEAEKERSKTERLRQREKDWESDDHDEL